jgi:hypothetical protein
MSNLTADQIIFLAFVLPLFTGSCLWLGLRVGMGEGL